MRLARPRLLINVRNYPMTEKECDHCGGPEYITEDPFGEQEGDLPESFQFELPWESDELPPPLPSTDGYESEVRISHQRFPLLHESTKSHSHVDEPTRADKPTHVDEPTIKEVRAAWEEVVEEYSRSHYPVLTMNLLLSPRGETLTMEVHKDGSAKVYCCRIVKTSEGGLGWDPLLGVSGTAISSTTISPPYYPKLKDWMDSLPTGMAERIGPKLSDLFSWLEKFNSAEASLTCPEP